MDMVPRSYPRVVLMRIESLLSLTDRERDELKSSIGRSESRPRGSLISEEGDASRRLLFLASGWALRQSFLTDGRRQIFGFILPGDLLEPFGCLGEVMLGATVAITAVELSDPLRLMKATEARPRDTENLQVGLAREHLH